MRYLFILITFGLLLISCNSKPLQYSYVIVEDEEISIEFLQKINEEERALLSWYLFAYGNECVQDSDKTKCKLLALLNIDNECSADHISYLLKWFSANVLMQFKLYNCPNLPYSSAIQNTVEKMMIRRVTDTIFFTIKVRGLNESQEKSWNIEQTDKYIIDGNQLKSVNR